MIAKADGGRPVEEEDDSASASTGTDFQADTLVGRLRFGKMQRGLLVLIVAMIGLIAAIGYQASLVVARQTAALNQQLQQVSGNMVSLERQTLTFALIVERWADGRAEEDQVELARSLLERQQRVTADEAERNPDLRASMSELAMHVSVVDALVAQGRPVPDSPERQQMEATIDDMTGTAKRLFDRTESQNLALVHGLEDGLRWLHLSEWLVAGLIILLVMALVTSMRRMLRTNYAAASEALQREQSRYLAAREAKRQVETRFQEVFDEVNDVVFRIDDQSRWSLLNQAWESLTGLAVNESVGRSAEEICHQNDRDRFAAALKSMLDGKVTTAAEEVRLVTANGTVRTVVITARAASEDNEAATAPSIYIAGTINDVTARARASQLAAAQTEVLELVALDTPLDTVLARIVQLIAPMTSARSLRFTRGASDDRTSSSGSLPLTDPSRGETVGAIHWLPADDSSDASPDGAILLAAQLGSLAIDRQLAGDRMVHQATHDALTGLPNRALLEDRTARAIKQAARDGGQLAMLFLDVDRFKVVNDSLGHDAGDKLLVELASRIAGVVQPEDTVARLGGDEFVVLLHEINETATAVDVAKALLDTVADPVDLGISTAHVTTSVGLALGDGRSGVAELMKNADVAMYQAKQAGRATFSLFDEAMQEWASQRNTTELDLKGALGRGEMELWYQPVVHLNSGKLKGYEALLRWRRPGRGVVPPGEFIDLVEELGMINEIGAWVLETAATQLATWQKGAPDLVVSFNVSGRELGREGYVDRVASVIAATGISPDTLVLEITESVLIEDTRLMRECLRGLKDLGVRLAIDDFGTGYSSLQYLRQLTVDILKIDRAFVSSNGETGPELNDPTIVASITDLAHSFGLEVVAEGIETEEQHRALVNLGVETGQGYHFGRPAPPAMRIDWPSKDHEPEGADQVT